MNIVRESGRIVLGVAVTLIVWLTISTQAQAVKSADIYGAIANVENVQISPDGTHYAAIQRYKGERIFVVYDLNGTPGKNFKYMTLRGPEGIDQELISYLWVNPERLLLEVRFASVRGATEASPSTGVGTIETRLISVSRDLDDGAVVPKQKRQKKSRTGNDTQRNSQIQSNIVDALPDDPRRVLIAFDREGNGWEKNLYKLDVYSGSLKRLFKGGYSVRGYGTDRQSNVRLRYRYNVGTDEDSIEIRPVSGGDWETLFTGDDIWPSGFLEDPNILLVHMTGESGKNELREYDLTTGKIGPVWAAHPDYDIRGPVNYGAYDDIYGAWYYADRFERIVRDEAASQILGDIRKRHPGAAFVLLSRDKKHRLHTYRVETARAVPSYYLYDAVSRKSTMIGSQSSQLDASDLFETKPWPYEARDGLRIPAYLTTPRTKGPWPTVMFPHGGPHARDTIGHDFMVQFMVSRGYAVLQPNFRGSTGYGDAFREAGYSEWGLKMQEDLEDGVAALVTAGIAEPSKVCIAGASYGGYAALMGVIKTPDLYRCAVALAPVTDLVKLLSEGRSFKFRDGSNESLGDMKEDAERLKATSPINHIDRIKVPVLLLHGTQDRVVPIGHSNRMAAALKESGKTSRYVRLPKGSHNILREGNRTLFLMELEAFLAKHIGD